MIRGDSLVPRLRVPDGEDDLCLGVRGYQLGGEGGGGQVADGLAVAEQLVPVLLVELALAVPLGLDGLHPQLAVTGRLRAGGAHVVCLQVPQGPQGRPDGLRRTVSADPGEKELPMPATFDGELTHRSCPAHTQHQHLHRDDTPALPPVDVRPVPHEDGRPSHIRAGHDGRSTGLGASGTGVGSRTEGSPGAAQPES